MQIELQKAENGDIEELIDLEKTVAGTNVYVPMLTHDEWVVALEIGAVYLIKADDEVVGNVSYEKKADGRVHISGLVIDPRHQGRGYARQAMEKVLKELKGTNYIDLETHPENTRALNLYQSLGFVVKDRKENFYGDGEPRLILVLQK